MSAKMTPGELAYVAFSTQPLAALCGVDRASFIAGYDTASQNNTDLIAALQECITVDNAVCFEHRDYMERRIRSITAAAMEALKKAGAL